ncbi:Gfo/Idh/MocA family oxidoreductase [Marinihelvus fidelis]|uniref:Gfo/Idh/MocA family oxidoreductase n=1 Tax=Marinihelvus fidelis TaxID=2613842 RepID=A0A5N0TI57_9GAMM|nr:Gfo/Idh/MocA family oxidoreductase [Marinihelvus fidelis]KAA9133546.1 Gfo/Idh/MocA family oxidoreductase [Marinihelvus fidelis]
MSPMRHSRRRLLQLAGATATLPWLAGTAGLASAADVLPRKAIGMPFPGGLTLPDSPPPAPSADSVGFAVVGLGYYGAAILMPALARAQRCHVAAVVSGNPDKANRIAGAYGLSQDAVYGYDDFERIADDDRVEAVYIVLPSGLHADWTEKAFAAGKHVLCEKPMALNSAECQRMIDASVAAERKLMIGYRCHFEPYNLRAMELMREDAVGGIRHVETFQQYRMGPTSPADNWRVVRSLAGGGPLEDYGIYGLQSALYLTGEMPSSISAETIQPKGDPRFAEIFASVRTRMTFPSGATAELFTSYDTAPGRNRVAVEGDAGLLEMEPATGYSGHRMSLTRNGDQETLTPGDPGVQFYRQCDHFADAIRDNTEIIVPGEMGLRDVRLMEAIYASAASGETVAPAA